MEYKIIGDNDYQNIPRSFFKNRGISDVKTYTHLTDDVLIPYDKLANIGKAVEVFDKHIQNNSNITIIVDCDVDGQCSAAMVYSYIKRVILNNNIKITYLFHTGKQHGLSSEIVIPDNTDLLIIPDAGTNDVEQCKQLKANGVDIIILDHHEREVKNPYAVIVNNQCSANYPNKELCGAGIVYKFLQALDDYYWNDYADDYLDLVALANISDMMDLRSAETKRLIDKGLASVANKCFEEFINIQNYSMKGKVNPHTIAFCITSLINAMCRVGDSEEKDLLFRAFIETDEVFEYKKRGEKKPIEETIYQRAVRLCKNAKSRQDTQVRKLLPTLTKKTEGNENAVLFVKGNNIPSAFLGLVAMKLADYSKKPCLILRKNEEDDIYRGSARNFDNSYIADLKKMLLSINQFNWCQGHGNAFGFEINSRNVSNAITRLDELCSQTDKRLNVDFVFDYENFNLGMISDVISLEDYYGTGIKEPLFVISNIPLEREQGSIMGKNEDTWKFITDDDVAIIKFCNPHDDVVLDFLSGYDDEISINALCQLGMSEYKGIITPQIVVKSYEVTG